MAVSTKALGVAITCAAVLISGSVRGEDIDTEHIFGFMIGSDVGTRGEREIQSQTAASLGKGTGRYRAAEQEIELEWVPAQNFRVEVGSAFAGYDIGGVAGLDDRHQFSWQGASLDLRYRLLARDTAPFGMTIAVQSEFSRIDELSGARARQYGAGATVAFDREVLPGKAIAAVNLTYQPEWTRFRATGEVERDSTIGAAFALLAQVRPGLLLGGESRYLRRYEGFGLETFAGQALFLGPTIYLQLDQRSRLTAAWSVQAWGRPAGSAASLDLVGFERHQARLIYGVNF
jgi:hypothetical protein